MVTILKSKTCKRNGRRPAAVNSDGNGRQGGAERCITDCCRSASVCHLPYKGTPLASEPLHTALFDGLQFLHRLVVSGLKYIDFLTQPGLYFRSIWRFLECLLT